MEYDCKQASIHTVAVVSWGGWITVKKQNERADGVKRTAANEKEASVR